MSLANPSAREQQRRRSAALSRVPDAFLGVTLSFSDDGGNDGGCDHHVNYVERKELHDAVFGLKYHPG